MNSHLTSSVAAIILGIIVTLVVQPSQATDCNNTTLVGDLKTALHLANGALVRKNNILYNQLLHV